MGRTRHHRAGIFDDDSFSAEVVFLYQAKKIYNKVYAFGGNL